MICPLGLCSEQNMLAYTAQVSSKLEKGHYPWRGLEHDNNYRPQREWYKIIVHVGDRTLQQRVQAGQGKLVVRL